MRFPKKKNHLCIHTHITYYYTHFPWTMTEMAFWVQQNEKTYGEYRQIMTDKHHRGWVSRFRTSSNGSMFFFWRNHPLRICGGFRKVMGVPLLIIQILGWGFPLEINHQNHPAILGYPQFFGKLHVCFIHDVFRTGSML